MGEVAADVPFVSMFNASIHLYSWAHCEQYGSSLVPFSYDEKRQNVTNHIEQEQNNLK